MQIYENSSYPYKIQNLFMNQLKDSGWSSVLENFIMSDTFINIVDTLYQRTLQGKGKTTPNIIDWFRAFAECPVDKLSVIIIAQDPYSTEGVANGICLDCSKTGRIQPSLRYVLQAVQRTVYKNEEKVEFNPSLKHWANQGVLLLNTALTVNVGTPGSDLELWKPFVKYLANYFNTVDSQLIFLLLGKKSHDYELRIGTQHAAFKLDHPAYAAYSAKKQWDCKEVFNITNEILKSNNKETIKW